MNPRTTVGLVVALVVAVVGVWWAQSSTREKAAERVVAEKSLFDPAIGDVVGFEVVQTSSGRPVKLVIENEKWRMTEPSAGPGEQHVVTADVNKLKNLTIVKTYAANDPDRPTDEMTLLKTPPKVVKLTDKSKSYVLKIGARQALSSNTYVQKEGDETIYLVGADLNADLKKDPSEYRGKQVAQFAQNEAIRVDVGGEHSYSLSNAAGNWTIESPIKGRVDKSKISTLLSSLSNLNAQKYVDDAPKSLRPYGLEKPRLVVSIQTEKKTPKPPPEPPTTAPAAPEFDVKQQTVKVAFGGAADDKVFAKLEEPASPTVFQIPEATFKQIALSLDDLRDRNVADMGTGRAQKISVQSGGESVELTNSGGQWQITGGLPSQGQAAEVTAVDDLLKTVRELKAVGFESGEVPTQGFAKPRLTVEITFEGRLEPLRLVFGEKTTSGTGLYVRNEREGFVAVVNADAIESLTARPASYMNRDLVRFDKMQATQIELTFPEWTCLLAKEGEAWKFKRPVEGPTEEAAVNNVLNNLSNLRGRRVVGRADEAAKFGLAKPVVQAAVTVQPPASPSPVARTQPSSQPTPEAALPPPVIHTVKVARHDGAVYAMTSGGETICEVDPKVLDDLVAELFDTRVATLEPSQARKIDVKGPSSFAFRKDGDDWRLVGEPTFAADAAKITELFTALRDLRAGQYPRYAGANPADYGLDKPEITITAETEGAEPVTLLISARGKGAGDRYAAVASAPGRVFVLKAEDLPKFTKQLSDFRKPG